MGGWVRMLVALALLAQLASPSLVRAQDASCDDLQAQLDSTNDELNQLQDQAGPWLMQASQFAAIVPGELVGAAQNGAPDLTPELAANLGGTAGLIEAGIDAWRARTHDSYWGDLANNLGMWEGMYATLLPFSADSGGLAGLGAAFSELEGLAARAQGDLGLRDALTASLADCQAHSMPPADAGGAPVDGALCSYGDKTGASTSDCFALAMDAAYSVWEACTLAYFDAEKQAFATGGDPPANTCDPAWNAQIEAIQRQWGSPPGT